MSEKLILTTDCLLLQRLEAAKSEFETSEPDPVGAVFEIKFAGKPYKVEAVPGEYKPGQRVLLKPGTYENINYAGKDYVYAEMSQVLAIIEGNK